MSTTVNMRGSPAASNTDAAPTTTTLLPETEALRLKLRTLSFILLGCGIVGFIGAFATYWIGFLLAIMYMVATGATISHTKDTTTVLTGSCCWGPNGFFHSLRTIYIFNVVCTCVGILFCVAGIVFHNEQGNRVDVVLAVIALIACLLGLPLSIVAAQTAGKLHEATVPLMNKSQEMIVVQQGQVVTGTVAGDNNYDGNNNNTGSGGGSSSGSPYGQGYYNDATSVQVYPAAIAVDSTPAAYEQQPPNVYYAGYNPQSSSPAAHQQQQQQQQPVYFSQHQQRPVTTPDASNKSQQLNSV